MGRHKLRRIQETVVRRQNKKPKRWNNGIMAKVKRIQETEVRRQNEIRGQ